MRGHTFGGEGSARGGERVLDAVLVLELKTVFIRPE